MVQRAHHERKPPVRPESVEGRTPALARIFLFIAALAAPPAWSQQIRMLVQSSPLAGYNYHQAPAVFHAMRAGDALSLVREPHNPHDPNAVRVDWGTHRLGYVPRAQNMALAAALDRGEPISARISRLQPHRNPRLRVEFEVYVE